jgi:hypothetical protein
MRTRRKAKDVDTAKAQKLIEVRISNLGQSCIIVDWLRRFLIVSRPNRLGASPRRCLRLRLIHLPPLQVDVFPWSSMVT